MLLYQQFRILDKYFLLKTIGKGKGKKENSDYIFLHFKYNFKNLDRGTKLLIKEHSIWTKRKLLKLKNCLPHPTVRSRESADAMWMRKRILRQNKKKRFSLSKRKKCLSILRFLKAPSPVPSERICWIWSSRSPRKVGWGKQFFNFSNFLFVHIECSFISNFVS